MSETPGRDRDSARRAMQRRGRESRRVLIGLVLIAVGIGFLLDALEVWTLEGDVVWPIILIVLGAWVLLGRFLGGGATIDEG